MQCHLDTMLRIGNSGLTVWTNLQAYRTKKYSQPSWEEAADNGLKDWAKVDSSNYTLHFMNSAVIKGCKKVNWFTAVVVLAKSVDHLA